jgi:hypothetical protein
MLNRISNYFYKSVMTDALKAARDVAVAENDFITIGSRFMRSSHRLRPFLGERPIMSDMENSLVFAADHFEKAGFSNPKYALQDNLSSSFLIIRHAFREMKDDISRVYKFLNESELEFLFAIVKDNLAEREIDVAYNGSIIKCHIVTSSSGVEYATDKDGFVYKFESDIITRFKNLSAAMDWFNDKK